MLPPPQGLAHEGQRLQASVTALQRELAARDSELAIRADEIASLREAQRGAQSQINQYIADLQVGRPFFPVGLGSLYPRGAAGAPFASHCLGPGWPRHLGPARQWLD